MAKKAISLFMLLVLTLGLIPGTASAGRFLDVPESHWAYDYIETAADLEIIVGTGNGYFYPDSELDFAGFATMLARTVFWNEFEEGDGGTGNWWNNTAEYCRDHRIFDDVLSGTYSSTLYMGDAVSRTQMALMLINAAHAAGKAMPSDEQLAAAGEKIPDIEKYGNGEAAAIKTAYALGLLNGTGDGTFAGAETLTRAQAVKAVVGLLSLPDAPAGRSELDGAPQDPVSFFSRSICYKMTRSEDGRDITVAFSESPSKENRSEPKALEEYIDFIINEGSGLVLAEKTVPEEDSGSDFWEWKFVYTGSKQIPTTNYYTSNGTPCVLYITSSGGIYRDIYFHYADWGLVFTDHGNRGTLKMEDLFGSDWSWYSSRSKTDLGERRPERPSIKPGVYNRPPSGSGSSGSGSSGSGSSGSGDRTKQRTPCTKCHGNGKVDCSRCGGSGGKWIYDNSTPDYGGGGSTSTRHWENCSKCYGTGKVTCPSCGGDGYIYV